MLYLSINGKCKEILPTDNAKYQCVLLEYVTKVKRIFPIVFFTSCDFIKIGGRDQTRNLAPMESILDPPEPLMARFGSHWMYVN